MLSATPFTALFRESRRGQRFLHALIIGGRKQTALLVSEQRRDEMVRKSVQPVLGGHRHVTQLRSLGGERETTLACNARSIFGPHAFDRSDANDFMASARHGQELSAFQLR